MSDDRPTPTTTGERCQFWNPSECEGSPHCPSRCPRFVDREGVPWSVVPADDSDIDALVGMYDDFDPGQRAQGLPPRNRGRIEKWLRDVFEEGCHFVARSPDRIVGHAFYAPTADPEPEFAVFVHQSVQNRGIGTELGRHVVATSGAADREALTLVVDRHNRAARAVYERLGFETVAELGGDRPGQTVSLRMRLPLSRSNTLAVQSPPAVLDR